MKWSSHLSLPKEGETSLEAAVIDCCVSIKADLGGQRPDLALAFVSPHFILDYEMIPELVCNELNPRVLIGCSAGGLIGGGLEVEQQPAFAVVAALLPQVELSAFHIENAELPDLDDPPDKWADLIGVELGKEASFILLADPFSIKIDSLLQGLDFAFPQAVKVGGLASGANQPGLNVLYWQGKAENSGAVGVALSGNLAIDTVVAQGCRPVGLPMRVTRCNKNFLYELDGKPAVRVLHDLLTGLPEHDQELARHALFLGVVMNEFKGDFQPGDFLIRNIIGVEANSGALIVGEILRNERTVQFHLRDASASADDLRSMLKRYRERGTGNPAGALLFSCLGRGIYLYGQPNHDSRCFSEYAGAIPLGGFFCNGEIGPVGGSTFLHGYTSFGIFRPKQDGKPD